MKIVTFLYIEIKIFFLAEKSPFQLNSNIFGSFCGNYNIFQRNLKIMKTNLKITNKAYKMIQK